MGHGLAHLASARSGATHPVRHFFIWPARPAAFPPRRWLSPAAPRCFPPRDMFPSAIKRQCHWKHLPLQQRAPCQGALFLAVAPAAEMGEHQVSRRPTMGSREDGDASKAPLLHRPALVATATRPPGAFLVGSGG
jgi:hypothetical protein